MTDDYPECPSETPDECRFVSMGCSRTLMHIPIVYNRQGEVVGGGGNTTSESIRCHKCGCVWSGKYTDLDRAQGSKCEWVLQKKS